MDFGEFESAVYELASDLRYTQAGESIDRYQLGLAAVIARAINIHRDTLREEYPLEPTTHVVESLGRKLETANIQASDEVRLGLSALKTDLEKDIEHRRLIAQWLAPLIPKMDKTQRNPRQVVKSLLNQPDLVYTSADYDLAEEVLSPPVHEHLLPKQEKTSTDELEDYELTIVAEGILRMLVNAAQNNQKLTKVEMYSGPEFTKVLRVIGDVPTRQTFHTAWEMLVAFFEEYDPNYEPFACVGEGWNRQYILKDPELAEVIWGMDDDQPTKQDPDAEEPEERVRPFEGRIIRITKTSLGLDSGQKIQLADDIQHAVAEKLLDRGAQFIGTGLLTQTLVEKFQVPRAEAELKIREFLSLLGPSYIERRSNSKSTKTLVRVRPTARAVLQNR